MHAWRATAEDVEKRFLVFEQAGALAQCFNGTGHRAVGCRLPGVELVVEAAWLFQGLEYCPVRPNGAAQGVAHALGVA